MHIQTKKAGITFAVHDVEVVRTPLPTGKTRDLLGRLLKDFEPADQKPPLYISGYNSDTLKETASYHTLFSTVHLAFAEHRPLVLSPDMIWITILQGFAQHVKNNSEELRFLLVAHSGKSQLAISRSESFIESPEYDWESTIKEFSELLRQKVGDKYTQLVGNFSSTGPLEQLVCEITLMDVFESYFEYIMYAGCGIPYITLEGTPADWLNLRQKIDLLHPYKIDWWIGDLRKIADQFYKASLGDVDKDFWQDMYKQRNAYGYTRINGWIARLVPYVRNAQSGECLHRNPIFDEDPSLWEDERSKTGLRSDELPSGLAQVPFTVLVGANEVEKGMQFLAGFVGAEQDEATGALRPMLGWAVREAPESSTYLYNIPKAVTKATAQPSERLATFMKELIGTEWRPPVEIPGSLITFYKRYDGLHFSLEGETIWRIRPLEELKKISSRKSYKLAEENRTQITTPGQSDKEPLDAYASLLEIEVNPVPNQWLPFLEENDGSYTCLELGGEFRLFRVGKDTKVRAINGSFEDCVRRLLEQARTLSEIDH